MQKYWEKSNKMVRNQLVDKPSKHRKTCTSQLYVPHNLLPRGHSVEKKRQNKEGPQDNNIKIRSHLSLSLVIDTSIIGRNWLTTPNSARHDK